MAGEAAESIALYRTFGHRLHWTPGEVDAQPIALLAAFVHDFEAERIRLDQRGKEKEGSGDTIKKQHFVMDDPRVPLSVKAQPVHVVDAWRRKWNAENPDKPPIAKPRVGYEMQNVPGLPSAE